MSADAPPDDVSRAPMEPLSDEDAQRHPDACLAISGQRGGTITGLYRLLLHAPDVAVGWCGLGTAVRQRTSLDGRLRETLICFVARATGSAYEFAAHAPLARNLGVQEVELDILPGWRANANLFSREQQAAFELAECILAARFDADVMEMARRHFSERAIMEVAATAAYYLSISHLIQGVGFDRGAS